MKTTSIEDFYKLQITAEMCGFNPSSFEEYLKEVESEKVVFKPKEEKQFVFKYKNNIKVRVKTPDDILARIREIEKKQINKSKFNS